MEFSSSKVVLMKTAWCDYYDGDEAEGNYSFIDEHGGSKTHENFNFRKDNKGVFYGYCPPSGKTYSAPKPNDNEGWTIVWVSKKPGSKSGVRIVGFYTNATLPGSYKNRTVLDNEFTYCAHAKEGFLVPPELRTASFITPLKSGPFCYIKGGKNDAKYKKLFQYLQREFKRLQLETSQTPPPRASLGFSHDQKHIKDVESAAIKFVQDHFLGKGYAVIDRQSDNVGYDLEATKKKERIFIEVKGTSGETQYAFMTKNEVALTTGEKSDNWRLAMVTQALSKPKLELMTANEFKKNFNLEPITFRATLKPTSALSFPES